MLLLLAICISIAKAERFDTVHWHVENLNKCEEITDMLDGKKRCFWRSHSRVIYVAGGLRNGEKLKICEMYDATAN